MIKSIATPTPKAFIKVQDLTKIYQKSHQPVIALKDISLEIYPGEIIAITGANDSGKSTLLHLLAGLDQPTSGQVLVDAQDLSKLSNRQLSQFRNQTSGFIFQSCYLNPFLTIAKNIEIPAMFLKIKRNQRADKVTQLLQQVGLANLANYLPKELSDDQIQRVTIARALINSPRVIFADETDGDFDFTNSNLTFDLLQQIRQDLGTTVVIATQDPAIVARADRHIVLQDGHLVHSSSPDLVNNVQTHSIKVKRPAIFDDQITAKPAPTLPITTRIQIYNDSGIKIGTPHKKSIPTTITIKSDSKDSISTTIRLDERRIQNRQRFQTPTDTNEQSSMITSQEEEK